MSLYNEIVAPCASDVIVAWKQQQSSRRAAAFSQCSSFNWVTSSSAGSSIRSYFWRGNDHLFIKQIKHTSDWGRGGLSRHLAVQSKVKSYSPTSQQQPCSRLSTDCQQRANQVKLPGILMCHLIGGLTPRGGGSTLQYRWGSETNTHTSTHTNTHSQRTMDLHCLLFCLPLYLHSWQTHEEPTFRRDKLINSACV